MKISVVSWDDNAPQSNTIPTAPSSKGMSNRSKPIFGSDESSEDKGSIEEGKGVETQEQDTIGK